MRAATRFWQKEKLEAHLALARAQWSGWNRSVGVRAGAWTSVRPGQSAVPHGQRVKSRLEAALQEVERSKQVRLLQARYVCGAASVRRPIQKLMLCATEREARFPAITCNCSRRIPVIRRVHMDVAATTDATDWPPGRAGPRTLRRSTRLFAPTVGGGRRLHQPCLGPGRGHNGGGLLRLLKHQVKTRKRGCSWPQ